MKAMTCIHALILLSAIFLRINNNFIIETNSTVKLSSLNSKLNTGPSELVNFEAIQKSDKVELFWDIKSKIQHAYFTLERSKNGKNFKKIATVDAGGNSNNLIQYIETDHKPLKGRAYYRLKLTDNKNKSTYSNVVVVNGEKSEASSSTPVNKTDLKKIGSNPILVVLRDTNGTEHISKVHVKTTDSEIIGTDHEKQLSPGTYTVKATSCNALYSQKLIVK